MLRPAWDSVKSDTLATPVRLWLRALGAARIYVTLVGLGDDPRVSGRSFYCVSPAQAVSADTVMDAPSPTFTVATPNAPVPDAPGTLTIPSLVTVAGRATTSGTGASDAESNSVLRPVRESTGIVLSPPKENATSVGMGALGVNATTKDCVPPTGISVGTFGALVSALVAGSVVW